MFDASVLLLRPLVWWKPTDLGTSESKAMNWMTWSSNMNQRYFLEYELECVGSICHVYGESPVVDLFRLSYWLDCLHLEWLFPYVAVLTRLSPSWMAVSLCTDLLEKALLPDVTFRSFWGQEIVRIKNQILYPFHCPFLEKFRFFFL